MAAASHQSGAHKGLGAALYPTAEIAGVACAVFRQHKHRTSAIGSLAMPLALANPSPAPPRPSSQTAEPHVWVEQP